MVNILIPGRHHLLTQFQASYLQGLLTKGLVGEQDKDGHPIGIEGCIDRVIFAVTSANHSNTRRNPLPFYERAMALTLFADSLGITPQVYPINDIGVDDNFGEYTIKWVNHLQGNEIPLTPDNTVVLCSTPIANLYAKIGYTILPAELMPGTRESFRALLPWEIVEGIVASVGDWRQSDLFAKETHPASQRIWNAYHLGDTIRMLFSDKMLGDDGSLTETRDYDSYVRGMDEIAVQKYQDTRDFVRAGRVGDIGCAVGSWIRQACADSRIRESDFFGVEAARELYEHCEERRAHHEFDSEYVFFSRKNAATGHVFHPGSMNTIHTSSLTHEIRSYGSEHMLRDFIRLRYEELATGGVWISRDVVGPEDMHREVYLWLSKTDGANDQTACSPIHPQSLDTKSRDRRALASYLSSLSTYDRFIEFAKCFRHEEGYRVAHRLEKVGNQEYAVLSLGDAVEFMTKKDYTDNWESEMHETFCYWSFSDHKKEMEAAGLTVLPTSRAFTNDWIKEQRWEGHVALYEMQNGTLQALPYPVTTMIMVGEKR